LGVRLERLARVTGGRLIGRGDIEITSAAPIASATAGQITFVANPKYRNFLETTAAAAVILPDDIVFDRIPVIRHGNPYYAFALILDELYPDDAVPAGIDAAARVSGEALVDKSAFVGAGVFIGRGSAIGAGCRIMPHVYIGRDVTIGAGGIVYPGVNILDGTIVGENVIIHSGTVIGSDGFGFAPYEGGIKKVRQVGHVEIGSNCEIGANCTIDRGALGPTRIGHHVKIDNLVQVAHNVEIGDYSIIVAQVGISGSSKLGRNVILAGQVGLTGHIEVGDGTRVGAQSGVHRNLPPSGEFLGSPAREKSKAARIEAALARLPELLRRVRKLEKLVKPEK